MPLTGRHGHQDAGALLVVPVRLTPSVFLVPAGLHSRDTAREEEDRLHVFESVFESVFEHMTFTHRTRSGVKCSQPRGAGARTPSLRRQRIGCAGDGSITPLLPRLQPAGRVKKERQVTKGTNASRLHQSSRPASRSSHEKVLPTPIITWIFFYQPRPSASTHREEERAADGGVAPVRFARVRRRPEQGRARGEDTPPLHQVAEVVGVAGVAPQPRVTHASASVGL